MSAIASPNPASPSSPAAPAGARLRPPPGAGRARESALAFAQALLAEQRVPLLARRTAARALALLLGRSLGQNPDQSPGPNLTGPDEGPRGGPTPIIISAEEAARLCDFEPRTWWLVKRRLLELGHLVASTGGGPPSGRPGGRGHKGAYFVAPLTLERFRSQVAISEQDLTGPLPRAGIAAGPTGDVTEQTLNDLRQTLNGLRQTVNAPGEVGNLSHHPRAGRSLRVPSLRLLEKKETSDVLSPKDVLSSREGTPSAGESPTPETVWAWARRETSIRVKVRLLRLLETLLVTEALRESRSPRSEPAAPQETVKTETVKPGTVNAETVKAETVKPETVKAETVKPDPARPGTVKTETVKTGLVRRARSATALWSGESGEEARVLAHVRSILEWANREHGACFPVARSARDTLLYPFERVRGAVANVLLKRSRGYRFENPGAVLWDGITLEGYKLEEFAVASLDEVLARLERPRDPGSGERRRAEPKLEHPPPPPPSPERDLLRFEPERRRRGLLQELYQRLPEAERAALDERSEILAREELGASGSPPRLRLRALDKRNELLEAIQGAREAPDNAAGPQTTREDAQISHCDSGRDEPEPIAHPAART